MTTLPAAPDKRNSVQRGMLPQRVYVAGRMFACLMTLLH
jgi:hypothetical protein